MVTFGARNFRFGIRDVPQTVVHELAHAWYGDTVTPDDWSRPLDERGHGDVRRGAVLESRGWQHRGLLGRRVHQHRRALAPALRPAGALPPRPVRADQRLLLHRPDVDRLRSGRRRRFDELVRAWPQEHRNTVQDRTSYVAWLAASTGEDPVALRAFVDRWLLSMPTPPAPVSSPRFPRHRMDISDPGVTSRHRCRCAVHRRRTAGGHAPMLSGNRTLDLRPPRERPQPTRNGEAMSKPGDPDGRRRPVWCRPAIGRDLLAPLRRRLPRRARHLGPRGARLCWPASRCATTRSR